MSDQTNMKEISERQKKWEEEIKQVKQKWEWLFK